jgi:hypothetical protein
MCLHNVTRSQTLLHYEDTALQLKDLYFIDPGWLCHYFSILQAIRFLHEFGILLHYEDLHNVTRSQTHVGI